MYFDALYALFILYTTEEQCKGAYIRQANKKPLLPVILLRSGWHLAAGW